MEIRTQEAKYEKLEELAEHVSEGDAMKDAIVATGPQINAIRILTLRSALGLELNGVRQRGPSAHSILKQEFGFRGNREKVFEQLNAWIEEHLS